MTKEYAYEMHKEINKQGGVKNWYNFGWRLGFFEPVEDETETDVVNDITKRFDEMISIFNEVEDYEKSAYFRDAIQTLQRYTKDNSLF